MWRRAHETREFRAAVGRRVKALRVAAGLSLDALAATTDLSKAGLWDIESGKNEPKASTLWRLSVPLNCTIDYLVKGE